MEEKTIKTVKENPLVSVGVPTFNRPGGLKRTLDSVTGQTYENLEIIVSDNCSPGPDTETIIRKYMAKDSRIHYYRQQENKGMNFNFKFVLEKATGEYFMWVADDDFWEPTSIGRLVTCLNNNADVSVVMSGVTTIDEQGTSISITRFREILKPDYNVLKMALFAVTHNIFSVYLNGLHRTTTIKRYTENLDTSPGKDMIIVTEMVLSTKFGYVDELLHIRQAYFKKIGERYPDEEVGAIYGNPFQYFSMLFQTGPFLLRSHHIPAERKLWIPLLVVSQGIWVTGIYSYRALRFVFTKLFRKKAP